METEKYSQFQKLQRRMRLTMLRWRRYEQMAKLHLVAILTLLALLLSAVVVLSATQFGWLGNGATRYMVLPGDTIEEIAAEHHVPTTLLVQVNRLSDPNQLRFGQILIIPESAQSQETPMTYIVQPGDNLTKIAANLGTTVEALISLNDLVNPSHLLVGQALHVSPLRGRQTPSSLPSQVHSGQASETEPPVPDSAPAPTPVPVNSEHYYYVKYGDSILGIANYFGLPVSILRAANGIPEDGTIHIGDKLLIPDRTVHEVPAKGQFIWPIESNAIIRGYFYWHKAVDVLMPVGSPIAAAGSGVVEMAGWHAYGYGNVIMLDHGDGTKSLYAHLNTINVTEGQQIRQGELIGETGHTGNSTHPHLHFELYVEGQAVYPCLFLAGGCR